jgi:catechol 2,3-dioxygenase-like lactoylglutathione lyase family enzyme
MVRALAGVGITAPVSRRHLHDEDVPIDSNAGSGTDAGTEVSTNPGTRVGFDSVTIVASRFAMSLGFYDAVFGALGVQRTSDFGDEEEDDAEIEAASWSTVSGSPVLWLVTGPAATVGAHLTLRAGSRSDVEAFFAAACDAGGTPRSAPRRWAIFRRGTVSAAVADPDGNTVEVVAPE